MVRLSSEVIDIFKNDFITSDNMGTTLLILLALYKEDYDFLDKLDDSNKDKRMILLYRDLVYKGYLIENEDNEESSNVHFSLTKKAINLINSVDKEEEVSIKVESKIKKLDLFEDTKIERKDFNDPTVWIKDWLNLFPVRGANSYPLRSGSGNCANKMRIFINNHDYSKDVIYEATKLYINDQAADGFRFTQGASNFISKAESGRGAVRNSTLETYCELVTNPETDSTKYSDSTGFNPFD